MAFAPVAVFEYSGAMSGDKHYLVLTAVGADRPGLVEQLSRRIHQAGANIEDSRMAILGGEFALILLFSGDPAAIGRVSAEHTQWTSQLGLNLHLKETTPRRGLADFLPYMLRISGVDRAGIVAHVSGLLAQQGINVEALDSRVSYAPLSGTPMFHLNARLQVPSQLVLSELRASVARLCEEENLDFWLEGEAVR